MLCIFTEKKLCNHVKFYTFQIAFLPFYNIAILHFRTPGAKVKLWSQSGKSNTKKFINHLFHFFVFLMMCRKVCFTYVRLLIFFWFCTFLRNLQPTPLQKIAIDSILMMKLFCRQSQIRKIYAKQSPKMWIVLKNKNHLLKYIWAYKLIVPIKDDKNVLFDIFISCNI